MDENRKDKNKVDVASDTGSNLPSDIDDSKSRKSKRSANENKIVSYYTVNHSFRYSLGSFRLALTLNYCGKNLM